jgi:hypothetical protein
MKLKDLNIKGAIHYWSLADGTDLESLREGFTEAGLAQCIPDAMSDVAALRRGLQGVYQGRTHKVEKLPGENRKGFAVGRLIESDDGTELEWNQENLIRLVYPASAGGAPRLLIQRGSEADKYAIQLSFDHEKKKVPAQALGQMLVRAVESLGGISLRPKGGFYWLDEADQERWSIVASTVEEVNPRNEMFALKVTTHPDTVDAVCKAVIHQVESRLDTLVDDLGKTGEDALGTKALETRRRLAEELDEFAERYESLFNVTFQKLRERADEVAATTLVAIQSAS